MCKMLLRKIKNKLVYEKEKWTTWFNKCICYVMRNPIVKSMDETIDAIVERRASISRYGDGEFDIIFGRTQGFQGLNYELGERLKEVLVHNGESDRFLVALPDCFGSLEHFTPEAQIHWKIRLNKERYQWYRIMNRNVPYYHAQISRFYFDWADKSQAPRWAEKLKKIWSGRNVLIVEGAKSRMGVGNDLFDGANSIRRILCPAVNAFNSYNKIIEQVRKCANQDDLILIALGQTATVLAYDLYKMGYQALDIGHVDVEYEWMKMGAIKKERIVGRFMNEIDSGAFVDESFDNSKYLSQIVYTIE
mgnify:FL=1|uniref:SP_1767 family glycosyltransferase n=1 Tax=Phocaeicola massiliensis TaxID=204516 RepID=UPI00402584F6